MSSPELIVFDLDFTLWDCGGTWCDCLTPPFSTHKGQIQDRIGRQVRLYSDVLDVLQWCDAALIPMALASRTEQPSWARELVSMLGIRHRFSFAEIYPSSKLQHFAALRHASSIGYERMLFFDDEMRNIHEVGGLGVTSVYVDDGLDMDSFQAGMQTFSEAN